MNATTDLNALKARQQTAWASGDHAVIGTTLRVFRNWYGPIHLATCHRVPAPDTHGAGRGLVDAERPAPNADDGIRATVARCAAALAAGDRSTAAESFIDHWMGAGAWCAKPEPQRSAIEAAVLNVRAGPSAIAWQAGMCLPQPCRGLNDVKASL